MEIIGKLKERMPIQEGSSDQRGEWIHMSFLVEIETEYPKDVLLTVFNIGRIHIVKNIKIGERIKVFANLYSIRSKKDKNKFYTNLTAYRIERLND